MTNLSIPRVGVLATVRDRRGVMPRTARHRQAAVGQLIHRAMDRGLVLWVCRGRSVGEGALSRSRISSTRALRPGTKLEELGCTFSSPTVPKRRPPTSFTVC